MKGFEFYKQAEKLGPDAVRYMFQHFIGSIDCVHEGFTDSPQRPDFPHAKWAVEQLETAFKAIPSSRTLNEKSADKCGQPPWQVDEVIRVRAFSGGFRVWRVTAVRLGATNQESVVELETLDRDPASENRMCVPYELLNAIECIRS